MSKVLAIIPARMGSKRLKKKNIKLLDGKPLFIHSVEQAKKSKIFNEIHVSSESNTVINICKKYKCNPQFRRPKKFASDNSSLEDVCKYVVNEYAKKNIFFDIICIIWATSPLRNVDDLRKSFKIIRKKNINAVVSVTSYDLPFHCGQILDKKNKLEMVFPSLMWLPTSKAPKAVCDNGSFVFVRTNAFLKYKSWMPPKTYGYEMPKSRSVDLDTKEDWNYLEYLYKRRTTK